MAATGRNHDPAGTVELVNAALALYAHPELRWLVRQHVLAVLHDFPSLSPSFDTYTSDDGASTVLLNAHGLLTVSSALPPLLLTAWLPREYPYQAPIVYVFPAAPASTATLVPDHPFVDHRTGRVRCTLPCLDRWSVSGSSLTDLVQSLARTLRMCHPLSFSYTTTCLRPERPEEEEEVDDEMAAMSSLQARLRTRANAMDRAVRELEEERTRLERAVTACLGHRDQLLSWLQQAVNQINKAATEDDAAAVLLEPQAAAGDAPAPRRWLESKASELAIDDTMDALGHALENGALAFPEYMKRVKILAREHFFHCHGASTSMTKRSRSLVISSK